MCTQSSLRAQHYTQGYTKQFMTTNQTICIENKPYLLKTIHETKYTHTTVYPHNTTHDSTQNNLKS